MSDEKDYAHIRDPEAQRTRAELWAIMAIVVVVVAGALFWRIVEHKPASPQKGWNRNTAAGNSPQALPAAAAAGVHPAMPPPPRPISP